MKKNKFLFCALIAVCAILMPSCKSSKSVIPQATNTINSVSLQELNLERKDYIVLNTISAEATIIAKFTSDKVKVDDPDGGFSLTWKKVAFGKDEYGWTPDKIDGVVRLGYLSNDYQNELFNIGPYPHWIVRRLAIYRLINAAKVAGGDGVIEPIISTNVEGKGKKEIVYKTTVSAKLVKIKPDGK